MLADVCVTAHGRKVTHVDKSRTRPCTREKDKTGWTQEIERLMWSDIIWGFYMALFIQLWLAAASPFHC